jgi:dTDP-4-dehydrorhamnose reductase
VRLLIVGHKGQLGGDLDARAKNARIDAVGIDLPQWDITDPESVNTAFRDAGPVDLVINAAAYTAVDRAEEERDFAYAVNRDGAGYVAQACRHHAIPLIHISTDFVFAGLQTRPYRPSDPIGPLGVYARSKADGEQAVREAWDRHLIIRISWLFGLYGNNFVKTMLRLGKERETLQVVDDQVGSPTYAGDFADTLLSVSRAIHQGEHHWGTYHYCNEGAVTWYAFARKIFSLAKPHEKLAVKEVVSILTAHYPMPAPRPHYSVLDCTTFEAAYGITRRPWEEALKEMLAGLCSV